MTGPGAYDPLKELRAVQRRMNDLFESALARTNFETSDGIDKRYSSFAIANSGFPARA